MNNMQEVKPQKIRQKKKLFEFTTKNMILAAVLTGLSLLFPLIFPRIDIGITSVTPFSHLAIMIGVFLNPFVALFTCMGALGAFLITGANLMVLMRATSHIIFAVVGSIFFFKGKGYKGVSFYAVCGIITLLHAIGEMAAALIALAIGVAGALDAYQILVVIGLITCAHSIVDYSFAVIIYNTLRSAKLVDNRFDLRIIKKKKAKETTAETTTDNQ